ncbi:MULTISPECIES: protein TolQ [Rhodanobacter]|jgi:biopolymer transport protein TolQ|uniref:Tol-Pal system protein TolQ n=1 Tax=Rhodanobacter glycinis TaxID=582702 RepID=A0A1I4BEP1_9GAMM|nr:MULTISPECIES: protein TolQ [Rhodanobacter]EIL96284.1 TolQ protein [Rhodanobacter sp. 115]QEE23813.1 protein TolQ [Rhodanobacter glycinis]TAM13854.1 MAG: protein TolQ [Rhodanobacter sp.]SFK66923.1 Cell division and transport-associated protein TolQ [Rhodanobacter glycinis]
MNSGLNIFALIADSSWPVKLVLLVLLVFSFMSWVIIVRKYSQMKAAMENAESFEERFWSGADLAQLFREVSNRGADNGGMENIFESGFREFARQRQRRTPDSRLVIEGAERAMQVTVTREVGLLERNLEFLANVGSISPYVGLFGTVWGIMGAFQGLGEIKSVTIAVVAPHISEALIATAMGLFAAIPAQWAYNRYANKVERVASRYDVFQEEFSSVLQRQIQSDDAA